MKVRAKWHVKDANGWHKPGEVFETNDDLGDAVDVLNEEPEPKQAPEDGQEPDPTPAGTPDDADEPEKEDEQAPAKAEETPAAEIAKPRSSTRRKVSKSK